MEKPDIYQYDDFRLFLKDSFSYAKSMDSDFSYRRFASLAGVKNPGFLLDVIKAKRSFSRKLLKATSEIFELANHEAEYLDLLVEYGQSRKPEEKQRYYRDILNRRSHSSFVRLNPAQNRYYEDTLYPLLVAAVEALDFRGDYTQLSEFLDPPVPPAKLKKAIRELSEWKLVRQETNGRYVPVNRFLEPPATMAHLVRRMNREWILQASDALMRIPADKRHISAMILTVSEDAKAKIQAELEALRNKVLEIVKKDSNQSEVMQLSLQYIPKSRGRK